MGIVEPIADGRNTLLDKITGQHTVVEWKKSMAKHAPALIRICEWFKVDELFVNVYLEPALLAKYREHWVNKLPAEARNLH